MNIKVWLRKQNLKCVIFWLTLNSWQPMKKKDGFLISCMISPEVRWKQPGLFLNWYESVSISGQLSSCSQQSHSWESPYETLSTTREIFQPFERVFWLQNTHISLKCFVIFCIWHFTAKTKTKKKLHYYFHNRLCLIIKSGTYIKWNEQIFLRELLLYSVLYVYGKMYGKINEQWRWWRDQMEITVTGANNLWIKQTCHQCGKINLRNRKTWNRPFK